MSGAQVVEKLYSKYYQKGSGSEDVGPFWGSYKDKYTAIKNGGEFIVKGSGFGMFNKRSVYGFLKHIPSVLLTDLLLAKFNVNKEVMDAGRRVSKGQGRILNYDCARQILSMDLMKKKGLLDKEGMIAVIGDGHGFMTSLAKTLCPDKEIICVNLGSTLFFDAYFVSKVFPEGPKVLAEYKKDMGNNNAAVVFVESTNSEILSSMPVSLFINLVSFQVMDEGTIAKYFRIMRSSTQVPCLYSCNRVEKKLADDLYSRFFGYPWDEKDEIIIDELCPWGQRYPIDVPPFWREMEGPVWHRLVKLRAK